MMITNQCADFKMFTGVTCRWTFLTSFWNLDPSSTWFWFRKYQLYILSEKNWQIGNSCETGQENLKSISQMYHGARGVYPIARKQQQAAWSCELELELIQIQMTQKPMLRAEIYARAWHSNDPYTPRGVQFFIWVVSSHLALVPELELELIQTQMTQKPMLRAEVYARALRASQNRKEDSVWTRR